MSNNDTRNTVNTIKGDAKDYLDEAKQRTEAAGERLSRAVQGDAMPLGDRIASHAKEALDNTLANADVAKRDARHGFNDAVDTDKE